MKYEDKKWLDPAFNLIKSLDPATYARMQASDWEVGVYDMSKDPNDMSPETMAKFIGVVTQSQWEQEKAYELVTNSFGNTPRGLWTLINKLQIKEWAKSNHVPSVDLLAETLVHEFRHHLGHDEEDAFTYGNAFTKKLPPSDNAILLMSQQGEQAVREGTYAK